MVMLFLFGVTTVLVFFVPAYASNNPEFAAPITNISVPVGREAILECTVNNLGSYKVAWIKVDTQTLLTIDVNVITRDDRIRVTHTNFGHWFLHIKNVQVSDKGDYMCQINTEPMTSQAGYIDVLVPPSILENETSSDTVTDERSKVSLKCRASGYPTPLITWRREDGKDVNIGSYGGKKYSAATVEGNYLNITQVFREDMGAYLCIASNGVPPSVSKRILLQVNFSPKIQVLNQLVGAAVGTNVSFECRVEAFPRPVTSWVKSDGVVLFNSTKYQITEAEESYRIWMRLKILNLEQKDFGSYKCLAKNSLRDKEGLIRLYEIPPPTTTPRTTTTIKTTTLLNLPRMRVFHYGRNETYVPKMNFGNPSTNSLMDESRNIRPVIKEIRPSRVENRLDNPEQPRRSFIQPTETSKTASKGCHHLFSIPRFALVLFYFVLL